MRVLILAQYQYLLFAAHGYLDARTHMVLVSYIHIHLESMYVAHMCSSATKTHLVVRSTIVLLMLAERDC